MVMVSGTDNQKGFGAVLLMGMLCMLQGCFLETHEARDPIALNEFCDEFLGAVCDPLMDCDCGMHAVRLCYQQRSGICGADFPSLALRDAVASGRVSYDATQAAALIARIRARSETCDAFIPSLEWQVRDLFNLENVFQGTFSAGASCVPLGFELISECELGICSPTTEGYRCRTAVGVGERCDAYHQCVALEQVLHNQLGVSRLSLHCETQGPDIDEGICVQPAPIGAPCSADVACDSTACMDARCVVRANGDRCILNRECESGYCRLEDRRCAAGLLAEGALCDVAAACESDVCIDGRCFPVGCGTF